MTALAIGGLGTPELLIILAVLILLFGAAKLPELARGSGRALRIFKAETKGLMDDDEDETSEAAPKSVNQTSAAQSQAQLELEAKQRELARRQAELDAEADKLSRGDSA
ncbi:MAG: sec-independent protein translocase protein TatA [Nocardioidaceae bacterium]|jgi:sec-independent protein translocase protein TatA|nr:sec-independent protein translocase protein TatA [Nocardioidaceae bacterium]